MITYEEEAELVRLAKELGGLFAEFTEPQGLDELGFDTSGGFFRGERIA
ncbi:hypothetical protein LKL35_26075 [Streptomyces sp. ET3-23]|nr:hypothetical protein [Streptomyces sp. ET3-23]MCC2278869.1 hypothetical protein [Streptomyces sp. ET3-23]